MNKQAGAIVVSILFAMGMTATSYAAAPSEPLHASNPSKVKEGTNAVPER
jgi:hypothetical protein